MLTKSIAIIAALAGAGCLRQTLYRCETNDQCNSGGVCEANNYCSFSDTDCAGGRRYGDLSGTFSGKCVGEVGPGEDAGMIDTPMPPGDGMNPDTPISSNCPSSYTAIGGSTKRYRVIAGTNTWANHVSACDGDGANTYLAVPDDQAELTAILGAANADIWVGASDSATENTFATTNAGTLATNSPLWAGGEPDNQKETGGGANNGNCVVAQSSNDRLSDDRCDNTYAAVCECDP
jgi:hypothetical protein